MIFDKKFFNFLDKIGKDFNTVLYIFFKADSTYKTNVNNFPIGVIGTSDVNQRFFPGGVSLFSEELAWSYEILFNAIKALGIIPEHTLLDINIGSP